MFGTCKKVDCNNYNDNNNDRNETAVEVISRHRKRLEFAMKYHAILGIIFFYKNYPDLFDKNPSHTSVLGDYLQTFGMMSIVLGLQVKLAELEKEYNKVDRDKEDLLWNGFPIIFIWMIFFSLAFIIHGLELYTSRALINAWKLQTEFEMKAISNEVK